MTCAEKFGLILVIMAIVAMHPGQGIPFILIVGLFIFIFGGDR